MQVLGCRAAIGLIEDCITSIYSNGGESQSGRGKVLLVEEGKGEWPQSGGRPRCGNDNMKTPALVPTCKEC